MLNVDSERVEEIRRFVHEKTKEATDTRMRMIEQMACAFMLATDIPPDQVELVEQRDGSTIRWFYRRRESVAE